MLKEDIKLKTRTLTIEQTLNNQYMFKIKILLKDNSSSENNFDHYEYNQNNIFNIDENIFNNESLHLEEKSIIIEPEELLLLQKYLNVFYIYFIFILIF